MTVSAANFKKDPFKYFVKEKPVTIATDSGKFVLLSEQEFNGMLETAYLKSIPGMEGKLLEAMNEPRENFVELDWKNELRD